MHTKDTTQAVPQKANMIHGSSNLSKIFINFTENAWQRKPHWKLTQQLEHHLSSPCQWFCEKYHKASPPLMAAVSHTERVAREAKKLCFDRAKTWWLLKAH